MNSEVISIASVSIYALVQPTVDHKEILNWVLALVPLSVEDLRLKKSSAITHFCWWITYFSPEVSSLENDTPKHTGRQI